MGMYTELIFGAKLKNSTPQEIIDTLRFMIGDIEEPTKLAFDVGRNPLSGGSYYFAISTSVSKMWFDNITNSWHISTMANIKNYESEIEQFLEWIKPFIADGSGDRELYAIVIGEKSIEPNMYYLFDED